MSKSNISFYMINVQASGKVTGALVSESLSEIGESKKNISAAGQKANRDTPLLQIRLNPVHVWKDVTHITSAAFSGSLSGPALNLCPPFTSTFLNGIANAVTTESVTSTQSSVLRIKDKPLTVTYVEEAKAGPGCRSRVLRCQPA